MTSVLTPELLKVDSAVASEARRGLTSQPKTLSPWLFYDEAGSNLFEQITALPEYYLTRAERSIFSARADEIFAALDCTVTIAELGAGTASKTGILLRALARRQAEVLYQPIDISPSALEEARDLERSIAGVTVRPQVANYITETIRIDRPADAKVLALYIGSSIGNFSPEEAQGILTNLREQLEPGDALLLGTDLAPWGGKPVQTLVSAYDDAAGVTAAFNGNVLHRLNRELAANFRPECFAHRALWNREESRIEMHLESLASQRVRIPAHGKDPELTIEFAAGETIHTENSYKFTGAAIADLLAKTGFAAMRTFTDAQGLFAVTLASAI